MRKPNEKIIKNHRDHITYSCCNRITGIFLVFRYPKLGDRLLERGMTKSQMRIEAGLTTNVLANMNKGQHISMEALIRICDALDCELKDVVELVKTEE